MLILRHTLTLCIALLFAHPVSADALKDMQTALNKLTGQTPVTALVSAKVMFQQGDGGNAITREGEAFVRVSDDNSGMNFYYTPETLQSMTKEKKARSHNAEADTPTLIAINELQPATIQHSLSATNDLLRLIESSQYEGFTEESYNDKPARKLRFSFGLEKLSQREKKYVKKYTSEVLVWIDDTGTPIASHTYSRFSGSAFIFIRFSSSADEIRHYQRQDDRLLTLYSKRESEISGAGEYAVNHFEYTLTPLGQ
ncbi:MAG TPA: hypothetical protein VIC08_14915 [Cellvibrionaceae bacterium]